MRIRSDKSHTWDQDRIVASFRCDKQIWISFDEYCTTHYGNYKKSVLIESLIKKFLRQKNDNSYE